MAVGTCLRHVVNPHGNESYANRIQSLTNKKPAVSHYSFSKVESNDRFTIVVGTI